MIISDMTVLLLWILIDPPWHIDAVGGRSHHQSPYDGKLSYSFALFSLYYEDYLVRLEEFQDLAEEEDE